MPPAARLFVETPLAAGASVVPDDSQAHYLRRVLRLRAGAPVALFNGRDGEWRAHLAPSGRSGCRLDLGARLRPQPAAGGPALAFAPIRRARLELLVEKATELGARTLQPVAAQRAQAGLGRPERLRAHAMEAAEQCGRLDVPGIAAPITLAALLARGDPLAWGDPAGAPPDTVLPGARDLTLLVGPEGGFSADERCALAACGRARAVSLGPHILRAETAAIALLALWQAFAAGRPEACYDAPGETAVRGSR